MYACVSGLWPYFVCVCECMRVCQGCGLILCVCDPCYFKGLCLSVLLAFSQALPFSKNVLSTQNRVPQGMLAYLREPLTWM
jgi:hypothetical protein